MVQANQSRRLWLLTMRRFSEVAWSRHSLPRYFSTAIVPLGVAFAVPGLWWALCAAFTLLAMIIDRRTSAAFRRLTAQLDDLDEPTLRATHAKYVTALVVVTGAYAFPYVLMAFGPMPAPLIGLLMCAALTLACAAMHVMSPGMVFYSAPAPIIGLIANAYAAAAGVNAIAAALLAALVGVNAIVIARAGARAFSDLVAARLRAELAAEELEQRVIERTAQLAEAMHQAQEASRAKSAFLANMSHELRTPLNAVIGYAEIVEEDIISGDTRQSREDLTKIRGAAKHLLSLISEVLDFSRVEAGRLELRPSAFSLPRLLAETIDTVRPMAASNGTKCASHVDGGIGIIIADETRVRQCLLNLLSNAAKFTERGAIWVDAQIEMVGEQRRVVIHVRDNGPGISEDDQARLFQPFTQVDTTVTRRHAGAGLGLVISRRLARAMGGDISVSSALGAGSIFTLTLPLEAEDILLAAA